MKFRKKKKVQHLNLVCQYCAGVSKHANTTACACETRILGCPGTAPRIKEKNTTGSGALPPEGWHLPLGVG